MDVQIRRRVVREEPLDEEKTRNGILSTLRAAANGGMPVPFEVYFE
jgi:hypothetical protein